MDRTTLPISPVALAEPVCANKKEDKQNTASCVKKPLKQKHVVKKRPATCASELKKYNWPKDVAYRVMMQESTNDHKTVNDTPATGDYSIGCFQINLYGANARTRPSEPWLKNPKNNVSYAYRLWKGKGGTFWTDWPNTCRKVGC